MSGLPHRYNAARPLRAAVPSVAAPDSPDTSFLGRVLRDLRTVLTPSGPEISPISGRPVDHLDAEAGRRGFASAMTAHGGILALILFGVFAADEIEESGFDLPGLVFLVEEGPGGGGGGGGDETEAEPLEVQTVATQNLPEPEQLVLQDPEDVAEEILEDAVNAPFAPDPEALAGLIRDASDLLTYRGPGRNSGAGTGTGGGLGEGDGDGIGEGTGGGFGGGAYRIGSGVDPPRLRRRVTPEYTDDALARKIEGIVILEVVILKSGRIGPARVIRSLDAGLDAKAIAAVREWTFQPGRYRGEAVDVLAEIEVEFRLL